MLPKSVEALPGEKDKANADRIWSCKVPSGGPAVAYFTLAVYSLFATATNLLSEDRHVLVLSECLPDSSFYSRNQFSSQFCQFRSYKRELFLGQE